MIKILTIVGARPQFIKAAALSRVIREEFSQVVSEVILHTGKHYDSSMSDVFFQEMAIPEPAYNLDIGSDTHGIQTGRMMQGIEEVILKVCKWFQNFGYGFVEFIIKNLGFNCEEIELEDVPPIEDVKLPYFVRKGNQNV